MIMVTDKDRHLFTICQDCNQYIVNCAILRMLYSLEQNLKFSKDCPCHECLIKVQCDTQCPERKMHYTNTHFKMEDDPYQYKLQTGER